MLNSLKSHKTTCGTRKHERIVIPRQKRKGCEEGRRDICKFGGIFTRSSTNTLSLNFYTHLHNSFLSCKPVADGIFFMITPQQEIAKV